MTARDADRAPGGDRAAPAPGPEPSAGARPNAGGASFESTYGVPRTRVAALDAIGIAMVAAFAVLFAFPATKHLAYRLLTDELGPVELATFGCFLAASIVAGLLAREALRHGERRSIVGFHAGLAVFCVLVAMEEISWGQSLVSFATPGWLDHLNEQGEFNLHDIIGLKDLNSVFVLVLGIAGLIGVRLDSSPRLKSFGVPRALAPLVVLVTVMAAIETYADFAALPNRVAFLIGALSEAGELIAGQMCLLTVWLHGRRLANSWHAQAPASAAASALRVEARAHVLPNAGGNAAAGGIDDDGSGDSQAASGGVR